MFRGFALLLFALHFGFYAFQDQRQVAPANMLLCQLPRRNTQVSCGADKVYSVRHVFGIDQAAGFVEALNYFFVSSPALESSRQAPKIAPSRSIGRADRVS